MDHQYKSFFTLFETLKIVSPDYVENAKKKKNGAPIVFSIGGADQRITEALTLHYKLMLDAPEKTILENSGLCSAIETVKFSMATRESIAKFFRSFGDEENAAKFDVIQKENEEIKHLNEELKSLKEEMNTLKKYQFKFMTPDLILMAKIQREHWKDQASIVKLEAIKLEIAIKLNPEAKEANAKAKTMGALINPNK